MPSSTELEAPHHYGLDKSYEFGLLLLIGAANDDFIDWSYRFSRKQSS